MENEAPKAETGAGETVKKEKSFGAKDSPIRSYVSKLSRTTKTFIIVLVVAAIVMAGAYRFKGIFIAATVNGNPISRLSVVRDLEKKAGKNELDTLITKRLISDEVRRQGIVIKNEDVDNEIKNVEAQIAAQGATLEQALAGQGMTLDDLKEQIMINKELEKLLADKIAVSDDEVNQYLSANKVTPTKGVSSDDLKSQTREQLKGQKFNTEATKLIDDLKAKARINYYTQY